MFDLSANGCVLEHIDVLVEHLPRAIEVSNHVNFVAGFEVLHKYLSETRPSVGNELSVTKSADALAQDE